MEIGIDYQIDLIFNERFAEKQQEILHGFHLIAAMEYNNCAFNMNVVSNKLTNNIWVGDTGASCHMRYSVSGMYDLEPGSGGINVGSRKILKIVKTGKF